MSGDRGPLDFDDGHDGREGPASGGGPGGGASAPKAPPPARPQGASKYGWFVGLVAVLLIGVVTLNSVRTEGVESGGPKTGNRLQPFAVPLAESKLRGDANVAEKAGQGELGKTPACSVRGRDVLNVCQLAERGPVVLALFPSDAGRCRGVLRQFERAKRRHREVQFAAVGSRGDRKELAGPWTFPVGFDRDGAVASVYGLVGCPQITFARKGGVVIDTVRTEVSDAKLDARIKRLG